MPSNSQTAKLSAHAPNKHTLQQPQRSDRSRAILPANKGEEATLPTLLEPRTDHFEQVNDLLQSNQAEVAANYIETVYSSISSAELELLKQLFWRRAIELQTSSQKQKLKLLYLSAAEVFDEAPFWQAASDIAAELKEWPLALSSMKRAALLESQPDQLQENLFALVKISSHLRAGYAPVDDEISIQKIYQDLHREHPTYGRFQLELAQSYLRAGNTESALPLLQQLLLDPEFAALAKTKLDNLQQTADSERIANIDRVRPSLSDQRPTDIIVPLQRIGNSFLVSGSAQGQRVTMLLDTGASITALSKDLITRLNLVPTGQEIRLSTANGLTQSRLFKLDKLRLGKIYVQDIVVAEIDLAGARNFQALLGTDLLNKADPRYSYLIDNTKNALIFRRK